MKKEPKKVVVLSLEEQVAEILASTMTNLSVPESEIAATCATLIRASGSVPNEAFLAELREQCAQFKQRTAERLSEQTGPPMKAGLRLLKFTPKPAAADPADPPDLQAAIDKLADLYDLDDNGRRFRISVAFMDHQIDSLEREDA